MGGGIEGEVARGFAATGNTLDEFELAVFGTDGEGGDGIFSPVACVEGEAIGGDG